MTHSQIPSALAHVIRICRRAKLLFATLLVVSTSLPVTAQLSGTVYTTDYTGTTVQANLFNLKTDVYLNGGPQNQNAGSGLPDGTYYFQVTDPSGAILLSADDISCRQVVVSGGIFVGPPTGAPPASCTASGGAYHTNPTVSQNLNPPGNPNIVQLCPAASNRPDTNGAGLPRYDASNWCDSTGNPGGVYKVWVTAVSAYVGPTGSCPKGNNVHGFCDSAVKTKTFKVRPASGTNVAYLTVCKFNDLNGNGIQDVGEPNIVGWPISANGVDTESGPIGQVNEQTDDSGCVAFSVSTFPNSPPNQGASVTVTEGLQASWEQTAPEVGTYSVSDGTGGSGTVPVTVATSATPPITNFQTLTILPGDNVTLNSFGNTCVNFDPQNGCGGNSIQLTVTKDANPSLTRAYKWQISKSADKSIVYTAGGATSDPVHYTVDVSHDAGTDSNWKVTGTITISNPSLAALPGVTITDSVDNSGTCSVSYPDGVTPPITIPGGTFDSTSNTITASTTQLNYTCTYSAQPADGTNTATATWGGGTSNGYASIKFAPGSTAITYIDSSVTVTDSLDSAPATTLGTVSVDSAGVTQVTGGSVDATNLAQADFTYTHTYADPAGACTSHSNTATFTSATIPVTGSPTSGNSDPVLVQDCQGADLTVSKTAAASFTRTYNWTISKSGIPGEIDTASGASGKFNYSVTASETGYTDSNWQVTGTITVNNPNLWEAVSVTLSDSLVSVSNASCSITGGNVQTVAAATSSGPGVLTAPYTCTYTSAPSPLAGTNSVSASWCAADNCASGAPNAHTPHSSASNTAAFDFSTVTPTKVNTTITPTDTFNGGTPVNLCTLAGVTTCTLTATDSTPYPSQLYTYSRTITAPTATCATYPNTAATGLTGAGQTAGASVKICGASPLTIAKTAQGSFNYGITKTGPASPVQNSGTYSLKYTVKVTEGGWSVTGNITVTNPNDWETVGITLTDVLSDTKGTCSITGGAPTLIGKAGTATGTLILPYTCSFTTVPSSASGTNTATVSWSPTLSFTGGTGKASSGAGYGFMPVSLAVMDTFTNVTTGVSSTTQLGTVSTPTGSTTFSPTYSVTPPAGTCVDFSNTAWVALNSTTPVLASSTWPTTGNLTVCNTGTGALTMGFWKNPNGQGIINPNPRSTAACPVAAWLAGFNPFHELSTSATCSTVANYVSSTIGAATCSSSTNTCNSMLKAQMLATALDVYFSDPNLGGNKIGPYSGVSNNPPLGGVVINLSAIRPCTDGSGGATCSSGGEDTRPEFGVPTSCQGETVIQMLNYANVNSIPNGSPVASVGTSTSPGGSTWYKQTKSLQVPAKDSFDDFNNEIAPIAPAGCPIAPAF